MPDLKIVSKPIPIKWVYPDDLVTQLAHNLVVNYQQDGGLFTLSFFETWQPPILGDTQEDRQKFVDEIKSVEGKCIARIVITSPDKLRAFIKAMTTSLENAEKLQQMTLIE